MEKQKFQTPKHATPIDLSDLKIDGISSYKQLSAIEAEEILRATVKFFSKRARFHLTPRLIKQVHLKMFKNVWNWAGKYRATLTNIGVKPYLIMEEIGKLCDDWEFWRHAQTLSLLEKAALIHHRLVWIHPFENGNGRHARLLGDLFLHSNQHPYPKWPIEISEEAPARKEYLKTLKRADQGDIDPLIKYMENLL